MLRYKNVWSKVKQKFYYKFVVKAATVCEEDKGRLAGRDTGKFPGGPRQIIRKKLSIRNESTRWLRPFLQSSGAGLNAQR